jgi:multidrug resistance efflux pump
VDHAKIPIPRAQIWRQLRVRFLPGVVFAAAALVVFQLWSQRVDSANMSGVVVGVQAEIRSPGAGYLTQLAIERFGFVSAGDTVGTIVTTDPDVLSARLAVVLAEVEMIRLGLGTDGHQRNLLNREALEMDLIEQRIALAATDLKRQRAEREYRRARELRDRGLIPEDEFELAESELELLTLEVQQSGELIETMRARMQNLRIDEATSDAASPISAAIRLQDEKLRLIEAETRPMELVAPIDGMVARMLRSNGERVGADEPLAVIHSPRPEYVVGYLPQPFRLEPKVGMLVTVRSNSYRGQEFTGHVMQLGVHVEEMHEVQMIPRPAMEKGLPIKIALNGAAPLRPGEIVNVTLSDEPASGGNEDG